MGKPLSALQKAYLLGRSEHLPLGGVAMQEFREYRGKIDSERLEQRLTELVRRHEALRTHIDVTALTQYVSDEIAVNLDIMDLRSHSADDAWRHIDAVRESYSHQIHDLSSSPWHVLLFHLPKSPADNEDSEVLFARFDALILDGRSISTLLTELLSSDEMTPYTPAPLQSPPEPDDPAKHAIDAAYWAEKLRDIAGPPRLSWQVPLEQIGCSRYRRETIRVDKSRLDQLSRIGASQHLFRNTVLSALIFEVLSHWTAGRALHIGVPVAPPLRENRMTNGSSFIVVHYDASQGTLLQRMQRVQQDILQGLQHLSFSGVDINRLLLRRLPGKVVLPIVVTNGLSWPQPDQGCSVRWHDGLTQTPQIAMDIRILPDHGGGLSLSIDYAEKALRPALVRNILHAIGKSFLAICQRQEFSLETSDIFETFTERLDDTATSAPFPFLRRVAENLSVDASSKDAIVYGSERISYQQLGQNVTSTMSALAEKGITAGKVVAICLPRSPEHLVITLACALSGVIWVPIDAKSPPDRLAYLLENCQPDLIVSQSPGDDLQITPCQLLSQSVQLADLSTHLDSLTALSRSADPAYYLYTSGTTGKPKCVVLSNRATAHVIGCTQTRWAIDAADVFISVTPWHHDMAVFDLFGALSAGATLVIPTQEEEKDAIHWNRLVQQHRVSIWCSVPAILDMLLSCRTGQELSSLRLIAQGGDYIKPAVIERLRQLGKDIRLFSLGGPTETTIWSIWHEITPCDKEIIPYGRPLPGTRYFVCDETGAHCPPGVIGRIHTAGINLAIGYLEAGSIRQNDFITLTDQNGVKVRAFRTGDLGQYREDGCLLFAGRVDGYVKVRGIRVSLPDIEMELRQYPDISDLIVIDLPETQTNETSIVAIYTTQNDQYITTAQWRAFARDHLPDSHVPSRFVQRSAMPLSANGKVDRRAVRGELMATNPPVRASDTGTSQRILDIYLSALGEQGAAGLDEHSPFLSMGLRPSHLRQIASNIAQTFGVSLSAEALIRCRNARHVSELLHERSA